MTTVLALINHAFLSSWTRYIIDKTKNNVWKIIAYLNSSFPLRLKSIKIYGWTPQPYTKEEIESDELPMPANLKTEILKLPAEVVRT